MLYKEKIILAPDMKVANIVMQNPYLILMLEHFEIKLGVKDKTVEQICAENKLSQKLFLAIANLFVGVDTYQLDTYNSNDIHTIIKYLKNSHQYYLNEKYPQAQDFIKRIYQLHKHPEILMIENFFNDYFLEVKEHLDYEDRIVFPYVLHLDKKLSQKRCKVPIPNYSVTEYREHHNDIEEKLIDLKNLLIKYLPQKEIEPLRRQFLFSLYELEYDLTIHSQIEENILIPLVEKMEMIAKEK